MTTTGTIDINQLQVPYGRNAILERYKKYGRERDETCHEMVFNRHFKPLAIAQQKSKPRPVTMEVKQITRVKHKGSDVQTIGEMRLIFTKHSDTTNYQNLQYKQIQTQRK